MGGEGYSPLICRFECFHGTIRKTLQTSFVLLLFFLCDNLYMLCDNLYILCDNLYMLCDNLYMLCDNLYMLCDNLYMLCDNLYMLCYKSQDLYRHYPHHSKTIQNTRGTKKSPLHRRNLQLFPKQQQTQLLLKQQTKIHPKPTRRRATRQP